jgi:hypothetical protein
VMSVDLAAFGCSLPSPNQPICPGSTLETFSGVPNGPLGGPPPGLIINGIGYSSRGPSQASIGSSGGPSMTGNVSAPYIFGLTNNGGLTLTFLSLISTFGYGYEIAASGLVSNATTISLFDGSTPVGSLSYDSTTFIPSFGSTGGFAGIQSTIPFNTAVVTFSPNSQFLFDNVRTSTVAAPEPPTMMLMGIGFVGLLLFRRHRTV